MDGRISEVLHKMRGKRILVLGDMIADVYLTGNISRISREAPVLVLEHREERIVPGGASNVVHNVATLGGAAVAVGVVGQDTAAEGLSDILAGKGVAVSGLVADASRPTTAKTRVIAGGRATVSQQIVRIDKEDCSPLSPEIFEKLRAYALAAAETAEGVVLSDYGGAVISDALAREVLTVCKRHGVPTIVDSRYSIRRFVGVDYVKQNDAELSDAMGVELTDEASLRAAGEALRAELSAKGVLVTRGEKGMTLCLEGGRAVDVPVVDKSEVFDVSGAGDTCVAAFILAIAAGAAPEDAARLSNVASGIAVRKMGTATVSAEELRAAAEKQLGGHIQ
ncbi:MAG: carbohydrate kinase [Schwartzia sp.]|nr:carbohydrate kinase [Schwartzia sp. (in: firmicutes)]